MNVFTLIWNTEDCIDSIKYGSLEEAKAGALEIIANWKNMFLVYNDCPVDVNNWTQEQIDDWDFMIDQCWTEIRNDNGDVVWEPTAADLEQIGWTWYDELIIMRG